MISGRLWIAYQGVRESRAARSYAAVKSKTKQRKQSTMMNSEKGKMQSKASLASNHRRAWGNALVRFCAIGLILSSLFKFSRLPGPIAYMASLGYQDGFYFLIAALELLIGVAFWLRLTRPLGLLLVSSYFGGAISAHLASGHPSLARSPYMAYMLNHPLAGAIPACVFLASAWIGVSLLHPDLLAGLRVKGAQRFEFPRQAHPQAELTASSRLVSRASH